MGLFLDASFNSPDFPPVLDDRWLVSGMDVGLEYRPFGKAAISPFIRGGLGIRSVVLLRPILVARPVQRYRWVYDEFGNLVELRIDEVTEYDVYFAHLTRHHFSAGLTGELGFSFPVHDGQNGDIAVAPEVSVRYERFLNRPFGLDFSGVSVNLGLRVLF